MATNNEIVHTYLVPIIQKVDFTDCDDVAKIKSVLSKLFTLAKKQQVAGADPNSDDELSKLEKIAPAIMKENTKNTKTTKTTKTNKNTKTTDKTDKKEKTTKTTKTRRTPGKEQTSETTVTKTKEPVDSEQEEEPEANHTSDEENTKPEIDTNDIEIEEEQCSDVEEGVSDDE